MVTCGAETSNHCRATAVAAREIGLECYLFLKMKNDVVSANFSVCTLLYVLLTGTISCYSNTFINPHEFYPVFSYSRVVSNNVYK